MNANAKQDATFDVVVIGSGAGAMTAAIRAADQGLSVVVIEQSDQYGGTSAVSGGAVWIPNNHQIAALGGSDSADEALAYLKAATRGEVAEERLRAYVDGAPRMVRYLEEKTRLRYRAVPAYADYYQDLAGAKPGFRSMDPMPFHAAELGPEFLRLREQSPGMLVFGRMTMTTFEAHTLMSRMHGWKKVALGMGLRYWLDLPWRLRSRRDRRLAMGNALVGALRRSMMDRNIPLWLDTAFESLHMDGGRITGVALRRDGRPLRVDAARAVILAAGGFERNQEMRERYLPTPTSSRWSATPPVNSGAGIRAGMAVGAAVALMDQAWWTPTVAVPGEEKQRGLFFERHLPHSIVVNGRGQRFANEAGPYLDFVDAMYADHAKTGATLPAWLIFDAEFRRKYPCGPMLPGSVRPDGKLPPEWLGTVYHRADTLAGLARQIGVDAEGLARSVELNNSYAATGEDLQFGKGGNAYDRFYGDPSVRPNCCIGPISRGPFYAVPLDAGEIGTKGGLLTNEHAMVLDLAGAPIPGLYAIGNTSASITGRSYPGAGATLGPAMTFGFIAANHISGDSHAER
ncbi:FAD-dependent oxidoreductase [Pseudoduganella namucuonensis]|nr:FAD-dependent oxidoreductase [Pseudoduganella namucuonensis]